MQNDMMACEQTKRERKTTKIIKEKKRMAEKKKEKRGVAIWMASSTANTMNRHKTRAKTILVLAFGISSIIHGPSKW